MRWWKRRVVTIMPEKFERLADYSSEVGRGIEHTATTDAEMAALQVEYNAWRRVALISEGWRETEDGLWVKP